MPRWLQGTLAWIIWTLLVTGATFAVGVTWLRPPPRQPLAFNHQKHRGMTCVMCHRGVARRARAGLPDIATCLKCHATAPPRMGPAAQIWDQAVAAKRIRWETLTRVPNHVFFSHRRHVGLAKVDCAICHGDIAVWAVPPPGALVSVTMARCVSCHREEHASEDCARCHK